MTQLTTRLQGLGAVAAIVAFLVGVPAVLITAHTTPWTTDWGMVGQRLTMVDNGTLLITLVGLIGWFGWAYFTVSLVAETVARIRGVRVRHLRGFAVSQTAARRLFDVAALAFVAVPSLTAAGSAPAHSASVTTSAQPLEPARFAAEPAPMAPITAVSSTTTTTAPAARDTPSVVEYTVRRGDSLWRIAQQRLGDGHRWSEIHRLNRVVLGDDPDFITAGTVLLIPHEQPPAHKLTETLHVVAPGDTLSNIAADELGDADRYPEIYDASKDILQPDGEHLTDPDLIKPGWTVDVTPDDPAVPEPDEATHTTSAPAPSPGPGAEAPVVSPPSDAVTPRPWTPNALAGSRTMSPSTPAPESRRPGPAGSEAESAHEGSPVLAWFVPGLAGAGAILGAGVYLTVRAHRRTQLRFRTPGHVIAPTPAELIGTEETARVAGGQVGSHVEALDRALRALASAFLDPSCYPPLVAVELTASRVTLHLADEVDLPAPWVGKKDTWSAPLHGDHTSVDMIPPYPMLVSIGQADDGTLWLLNLEHLGTLVVNGQPDDVEAFARHVAAELAVGPWSFLVDVHLVGVAAELHQLNSGRLTHAPAGDLTPLGDLAAEVESARDSGDWDPEALIALVLGAESGARNAVKRLATAIRQHSSRSGVAMVALNAESFDGEVHAHVTPGRRLCIDSLGIDVQAALLTAEESAAIAELVAITDTHENTPMPVDENATEGIAALVDAGGAIRREHVQPRPADDAPAGEGSLLPDSAASYAAAAAITVDDVHNVAPIVPDETAERVLASDPHLDRDLEWWSRGSACPVPRVELLGKTDIHGLRADLAVSERKQHFAELAAFLWAHPSGVRSSAIAQAFGCSDGRARTDITNLRAYFGERHVPKAPRRNEPGFQQWNGYHLRDVLVDVDLFRRLRARGAALGARNGELFGVASLARALDLVQGEPFTDDRSGSWVWLHQGERIDHEIDRRGRRRYSPPGRGSNAPCQPARPRHRTARSLCRDARLTIRRTSPPCPRRSRRRIRQPRRGRPATP